MKTKSKRYNLSQQTAWGAGRLVLGLLLAGLAPPLAAQQDSVARPDSVTPESAGFCCATPQPLVAAAEIVAVQLIPWSVNRFVRKADFAKITFESISRNIEQGFEWDPNSFSTNMFGHPYHGNLYYNAARNNGYDYWRSQAFAWGGSLLWELAGETWRPAINDWVMTSMGGIAIGEATYRASAIIRDNEAHGFERVLREIAGGIVNPVGGFNRLVHGDAWRVGPNPSEHSPGLLGAWMNVGGRFVGKGNLGTEGDDIQGGYVEVRLFNGNPFAGDYEKPFDSFSLGLQLNFNDAQTIGRLQIEGTLTGKRLSDEASTTIHIGAVTQSFDYVNNSAYQFGGQSLGTKLLSLYSFSPTVSLRTNFEAAGLLLGAVNSEYTDVVVGTDERDYDFGPGALGRARAVLNVSGHDLVDLTYDFFYIHTLTETDSDHLVHDVAARLKLPLWRGLGLGAEGRYFGRNSHYDAFPNVHRWVPQARLYLSYDLNSLANDVRDFGETLHLAPRADQ